MLKVCMNKIEKKLINLANKGLLNNKSLGKIALLAGIKHRQSVKHALMTLAYKGLIIRNPDEGTYEPISHKHKYECIYCGKNK